MLADAINRAGSTDREKIREALVATDVPGDQLIMPWKGVKFDEIGQNIEADAGASSRSQGGKLPSPIVSVRRGRAAAGLEVGK